MFHNSRNRPVTVARGLSPAIVPVGETSWSRCNRAARLPGPRRQKAPLPRRAWALGCHTRIRAGFPRHAALAGDRPPRYGKKRHVTVGRGPVPRHRSRIPAIAGDRPPRYGRRKAPFLTVGRGPVPRHRPRIPTLAGACPPRYGENNASLTVGRGPVPRHRSRYGKTSLVLLGP